MEKIFDAERLANENRRRFDENHVFAINLMASPAQGNQPDPCHYQGIVDQKVRIGVIEGDTAPVTIDADKISAAGIPVIQLTLEANVIWMRSW